MASYVGVNGLARKVANKYVGVNGLARKVKLGYVGVNGLARKYFGLGDWWYINSYNQRYGGTATQALSERGATLFQSDISEQTVRVAEDGSMWVKHRRLRDDSDVCDAYMDFFVAPYDWTELNAGDVVTISCTSSSSTSGTSPITWLEMPSDGSTPTWIYGSGSTSTGQSQPTSKSLALTNYSYTMKKKGVFALRLAHWNYYYVKAGEMSQVQITSLSVNGQKLI